MRSEQSPRAARRLAVLFALAAPLFEGCFDDPTEVVVVVDTDAKFGLNFSDVQLCFAQFNEVHADGRTWPVTVGVRRSGPSTAFNVIVKLNTTFPGLPCGGQRDPNPMNLPPLPFDTRTARDVRFVDGEMRVLYIPILKACACVDASGTPITNCTHALDPDCSDLSNPSLGTFDEDNLPHLPASAKSP
jgi:hypothetical protein